MIDDGPPVPTISERMDGDRWSGLAGLARPEREGHSSRVDTPNTASAVLCSFAARARRASFSVRTMKE